MSATHSTKTSKTENLKMNNTHVVQATLQTYGPKTTRKLLVQGSLEQCKQYIVDHKNARYMCDHNEAGRPDLRIRKISSLPALQQRLMFTIPTCTAQE